jgi:hypothetical protein
VGSNPTGPIKYADSFNNDEHEFMQEYEIERMPHKLKTLEKRIELIPNLDK